MVSAIYVLSLLFPKCEAGALIVALAIMVHAFWADTGSTVVI
ncbi:MAG: hypothetical protein WAX17_08140 [Psychrobacter urativorans]